MRYAYMAEASLAVSELPSKNVPIPEGVPIIDDATIPLLMRENNPRIVETDVESWS
jgi:hypothetical protein